MFENGQKSLILGNVDCTGCKQNNGTAYRSTNFLQCVPERCYLFAPCMKRVSVDVRQFRAFSHTV